MGKKKATHCSWCGKKLARPTSGPPFCSLYCESSDAMVKIAEGKIKIKDPNLPELGPEVGKN